MFGFGLKTTQNRTACVTVSKTCWTTKSSRIHITHNAGVTHNIFSKKEASPAGIHGFVVVHPLILSALAVKCALLQAQQFESKAGPQLLQASYHPP